MGSIKEQGFSALKRAWDGFWSIGRLREDEHRASIDALNLFFGAIVGVNFASMTNLNAKDYATLLFITATLIALILVVSNTRRRIWSAIQLIGALALFAWLFLVEKVVEGVDQKLMVTLAVWSAAALLYEFTPRLKEPRAEDK
ncbi:MAG: hypothetical protein AAGL68_00490 [Pseudomonadota bacterium]